MFLYIVRHGEPDYSTDTLTETGQAQAEAVSHRMQRSGIERLYCSPMGRARQTAAPTAALLGLSPTVLPWAEELGSESQVMFPDGKRRNIFMCASTRMLTAENMSIPFDRAFTECDGIRDSALISRYTYVAAGVDALLEEHGYRRRGDGLYDPIAPCDRRIALFCHAGLTRVVLSHVFNIPYQMFATRLEQYFTGVTVLSFKADAQRPISPHLRSYGDIGHLDCRAY